MASSAPNGKRGFISFTFDLGAVVAAIIALVGGILLGLGVLGNTAHVSRPTPTAEVGKIPLAMVATYTPYPANPTYTPYPTYAPNPTYTPNPTYAPNPTYTPYPTYTALAPGQPAPTVAPATTTGMTPAPPSKMVLYEADWSSGLNGWPGTFGWKALNGILLNDGSYSDSWKYWIAAPYQSKDTADYAVEAEIQLVRNPGCGSFGIVVRSAYQGGIHICPRPRISFRSKTDVIEEYDYSSPGSEWHKYRIEARGNTFRVIIDDAVAIEVIDNRNLSGGTVGLWSDRTQINVRSFKVSAP